MIHGPRQEVDRRAFGPADTRLAHLRGPRDGLPHDARNASSRVSHPSSSPSPWRRAKVTFLCRSFDRNGFTMTTAPVFGDRVAERANFGIPVEVLVHQHAAIDEIDGKPLRPQPSVPATRGCGDLRGRTP
jgi:hypothetical protein